MLTLFAFLLLAASAYGQGGHNNPHNPHNHPQLVETCHCNSRGQSEEAVVNELVLLFDHDHNQEIIIGEVIIALANILQLQLPVTEETILGMNAEAMIAFAQLTETLTITKADFVSKWIARFGDCSDFVEAVFDAFDDNRDGLHTIREYEGILFHIRQVSGDLDAHISLQETHDFFMWLYNVEGCA